MTSSNTNRQGSDSDIPQLLQVIASNIDTPLVEIAMYQESTEASLEEVSLNPEVRAGLATLLQAVPMLMATTQGVGGMYQLRFAPGTTLKLATGQVTLMQSLEGGVRAIAVDAQGRVVGHGTLVPVTGITPALLVASVWQLLAIATAQYYLHGMQQSLQRIETAIATVHQWLDHREIAQLSTGMEYLERVWGDLTHGTLRESDVLVYTNQVEHIDRDASVILHARELALQQIIHSVDRMALSNRIWWTVEENAKILRGHIDAFEHAAQICVLSIAVRAAAEQVRSILGWQPRVHALQALADQIHRARNFAQRLTTTVRLRAPELTSASDLRKVAVNIQRRAILHVEAVQDRLEREFNRLDDTTSRMAAAFAANAEPITLVIRRDERGEVTVYHPAPARAEEMNGEALSSAELAYAVIDRLSAVPGMTLASWQDFGSSRPVCRLQNGMMLRIFSRLGVEHVFLANTVGLCMYGGFVGPIHSVELRRTVNEIRRAYGV